MKAGVGIPTARSSDGKHVDVIDRAELLEEIPDPVDGPIVRAVGDEELAPLVEGDQGAPRHSIGRRWHGHVGKWLITRDGELLESMCRFFFPKRY